MATIFTNISGYRRFLIQPEVEEGETPRTYDTLEEWGLVAKTTPFETLPKAKEPYTNDWKDEDGVESYVKEVFYEPYEIDVKFYIKAVDGTGLDPRGDATNVVRDKMRAFFDVIKQGYFSYYDEYSHVGRKKVRYVSSTTESFKARSNWARCIFSVKFKVENPIEKVFLY